MSGFKEQAEKLATETIDGQSSEILQENVVDMSFTQESLIPTQAATAAEVTAIGKVLDPSKIVSNLNPEQQQKAFEIAKSIDIDRSDSVMNFGVAVQARLDEQANIMLSKATGGEDAEVNKLLVEMMSKVKEVMPEDIAKARKKGFFPWIRKKAEEKALALQIKTQDINSTLDGFKGQLSTHKDSLIADNMRMDMMLDQTRLYFQELNTVIAGGQLKINEMDSKIIPEKQAEYQKTLDPQIGQELMELTQIRNDLSIRVDDLLRAQDTALTQSYQMMMLKAGNNVLAKKLDNSVRLVLPIWKTQIAMSLVLLRTQNAIEAQDIVAETTNQLLTGTAEQTKNTVIAIAEANNKSMISMETLKNNHAKLIESVKEVQRINDESEIRRVEEQKELLKAQQSLVGSMGQLQAPKIRTEYGGVDGSY